MLEDLPILSVITFFPLLVAGMLVFFARMNKGQSRERLDIQAPYAALIASVAVLFLSILMVLDFDTAESGFQFMEDTPWLGGGIEYRVGVDGISVLFVLLTAFLTPFCILASMTSVKTRMLEYMVAFLVLETLMIGVFVSLDLILFYLFFEAVLIPMFIIIGVWGGKNRVYASYKFFLYTLLGSVLMLAAIMWIYFYSGQELGERTTDMRVLIEELSIPGSVQTLSLIHI